MGIRRAQHWTDTPIIGRNRRRVISNFVNYKEPGQPWRASDPEPELSLSVPDNWSGAFDFKNQSLKGPIQVFAGDTSDISNTAMVGVRRADRPECWLNLKALDVNPVSAVIKDKTTQWKDLWTQSDLIYTPCRNKLKEEIILKAPGHPLVFGFTLSLAPGHTIEFVGGGAKILDDRGIEVFRFNVPWAIDSSTVSLDTPEGHKSIGVILRLREGGTRNIKGKDYQVVELVLDEEDLNGAVYPVTVDPTIPITGTTDIEDNTLFSATHDNYGGYSAVYTGNNGIYVGLIRIATIGAIPGGTISALRLIGYVGTVSGAPQTIEAYVVTDANDWVEGTAGGAIQAGSSDWFDIVHGTTAWAGSAGCKTSGVDYDADASPPEHVFNAGDLNQWVSFALDSVWATAWRDVSRDPNGVRLGQKVDALGYVRLFSSEHATYPLYFEVDYEEAAAATDNAIFFGSNF